MLRQETDETASPSPAANVRVTPEELAAALARLEARQGEREGTIPLGDAVQELGLNATPEELLHEIEAGRSRPQENHPRTRLSRRLRVGLSGLAAGVLLLGSLFALRTAAPTPPPPAVFASAAKPQAHSIGIPDTLLVRRPDGKMAVLSEVPDGQPVLCDLAATDTGATLTNWSSGDGHWTLIKHGGRVYLRGWIMDMSDTALRSTDVEFHPLAYYVASGLHPVRVTVPLDGFQSLPGLTNDTMISASHVVPDEHLKEKW